MTASDHWPQPTLDHLRQHIDELVTHRDAIHDGHVALAHEHYGTTEGDDDADVAGQ